MDKTEEVTIRALPRGSEKKPAPPIDKKPWRWIVYVGTVCLVFLSFMFYLPGPNKRAGGASQNSAKQGEATFSSFQPGVRDPVNRHLRETQLEQDMLMRRNELQNQKLDGARVEGDEMQSSLPRSLNMPGVQLDGDGSAERIYEDLNDPTLSESEASITDKINSRLATRKWVNEFERRERVQFISNFIRSAKANGLEVDIDQNLVVVGVRAVNTNTKVNVDEILDRLARQGR